MTEFIIAVAALIAILISLWSLFYSHRSANASEVAVRQATRSADSAERSEAHAAASARAATESAQADSKLARLAEEERHERLEPNVSLGMAQIGDIGRYLITAYNEGPQNWAAVSVTPTRVNEVMPPVTVERSQGTFALGSLPPGGSVAFRVDVTDPGWGGTVKLLFRLSEQGEAEALLLERRVTLFRSI